MQRGFNFDRTFVLLSLVLILCVVVIVQNVMLHSRVATVEDDIANLKTEVIGRDPMNLIEHKSLKEDIQEAKNAAEEAHSAAEEAKNAAEEARDHQNR